MTYLVKSGDRVTDIAARFKVTARAIVDSNPHLQGRGISPEGLPWIYPGDLLEVPAVVNIPTTPSLADIPGASTSENTRRVIGKIIPRNPAQSGQTDRKVLFFGIAALAAVLILKKRRK